MAPPPRCSFGGFWKRSPLAEGFMTAPEPTHTATWPRSLIKAEMPPTQSRISRQALEILPTDALTHVKLGVMLADKGDYDRAIDHYTRGIELDPHNAIIHTNRAMTLARQGKIKEAIADINQALEIDPHSFMAHADLGQLLGQIGDVDEAIVHLHRAIALEPDLATPYHQSAYLEIAKLLRRQGRYSEAVKYDEQLMAATRRWVKTENLRGSELAEQGKTDEAIARFQAAIAADAGFAPAHDNLADALAAQGKTDDALLHYRRALEIDPADARAKSGLARWSDLEIGPASGRR